MHQKVKTRKHVLTNYLVTDLTDVKGSVGSFQSILEKTWISTDGNLSLFLVKEIRWLITTNTNGHKETDEPTSQRQVILIKGSQHALSSSPQGLTAHDNQAASSPRVSQPHEVLVR